MSSLVDELRPAKLPNVVFAIESDNKNIRRLVNLKVDQESANKRCSCLSLIGEEIVVEARTKHINVIEVEAADCFSSLKKAQAEIEHRKLKDEYQSFKNSFGGYRSTKGDKIAAIKPYAKDVVAALLYEGLVSEDFTLCDLCMSHFRLAAEGRCYERIVNAVVADRYPMFADAKDEDDE